MLIDHVKRCMAMLNKQMIYAIFFFFFEKLDSTVSTVFCEADLVNKNVVIRRYNIISNNILFFIQDSVDAMQFTFLNTCLWFNIIKFQLIITIF